MRRLLELVPFVVLVVLVAAWAVNVPYQDEWELVPVLRAQVEHTIGAHSIFALHNEHRPVLARVFAISSASITHWDLRVPMAMSLGLALVAWLLLRRHLDRASLPVAALLFFSTTQKENWFWAWQIGVFANLLATILAVRLAARDDVGAARALAIVILAAVATLSFGNGLLVAPVALVVLLRRDEPAWREAAIITITGALLLALYFHGYHRPPTHPPLSFALTRPLATVGYALACLGTPLLVGLPHIAIGLGLVLLVLAIVHARRIERVPLGIALYALGTAAMIAVSRLGLGFDHAADSRYTTFSTLLVIALFATLRGRGKTAFTAIVTVLALVSWVRSTNWAHADSIERRALADALVADDAKMAPLYEPSIDVLRERRGWLQKMRWSTFTTASSARR